MTAEDLVEVGTSHADTGNEPAASHILQEEEERIKYGFDKDEYEEYKRLLKTRTYHWRGCLGSWKEILALTALQIISQLLPSKDGLFISMIWLGKLLMTNGLVPKFCFTMDLVTMRFTYFMQGHDLRIPHKYMPFTFSQFVLCFSLLYLSGYLFLRGSITHLNEIIRCSTSPNCNTYEGNKVVMQCLYLNLEGVFFHILAIQILRLTGVFKTLETVILYWICDDPISTYYCVYWPSRSLVYGSDI